MHIPGNIVRFQESIVPANQQSILKDQRDNFAQPVGFPLSHKPKDLIGLSRADEALRQHQVIERYAAVSLETDLVTSRLQHPAQYFFFMGSDIHQGKVLSHFFIEVTVGHLDSCRALGRSLSGKGEKEQANNG